MYLIESSLWVPGLAISLGDWNTGNELVLRHDVTLHNSGPINTDLVCPLIKLCNSVWQILVNLSVQPKFNENKR